LSLVQRTVYFYIFGGSMFKNTRLSAMLAAVLFSVTAASALVSAPAFADAPAAGAAVAAADAGASAKAGAETRAAAAVTENRTAARTADKRVFLNMLPPKI
jgi:biopolymer transport protein ExbB